MLLALLLLGVLHAAPADDDGYETVVTDAPPVQRDPTGDGARVEGQALRDSARPSVLAALGASGADVFTSAGGELHGVGSGATGGMHIRGLGGSPNTQVLVVEDGVPDIQGIFGHPIPDAYVPFLLDQALVLKGGDSVLHGTNALGGVVVLRSRWRALEGFELENDAAFGSFATYRERLALLARTGRWDVAAAFQGVKTDGHRPGAGGDTAVGAVGVRVRLPRDLTLTLRQKLIDLSGEDPGPASHPNVGHTYDVLRSVTSLELAYRWRWLRLTVLPYATVGEHRLYDGFRSLDWQVGATAELVMRPHRLVEVLVGLAAEHVDGDVENRITGFRPTVQAQDTYALYHQLVVTPTKGLRLVVGARELVSATYGFVFLYKGGFHWDLWKGLFLRSRVTRNFRQPTIRELYLPFPVANPDLRPEHAINWDATFGWEHRRVRIAVTGYVTHARSLIRTFGVWPSAEVVNIDRVTFPGFEASLRVRALGPVSLVASGGWQDLGRYTKQNPEAKLDVALDLFKAWRRHTVQANLQLQYVNGLYMNNYRRDRIPDVVVLDATVRYRYTLPRRRIALEPYVLLRNLLDRRYAWVADYPMPGFSVLAGLKVGI